LKKSKFEEAEDIWSRRLKKSKKSKIKEVEVWRSRRLKIWSLETQPESATQVESRGLLTWVCPSGTPRISIPGLAHYGGGLEQGLEDDLETKKEGSNPYSTRTLVKP
jgi:hypothetical protein